MLIHLRGGYYDPTDGRSGLLESTLLAGTIGYAAAAIGSAITVLRGPRDLADFFGLATTVLLVNAAPR